MEDNQLIEVFSGPRLEPYLRACEGTGVSALDLYIWNTQVTSALFEVIALVEVGLRNAMDRALSAHFKDEDSGIPWFFRGTLISPGTELKIQETRARLIPSGRDTRAQIIGALTFGFWSGLLGSQSEELWRKALHNAFPHSDGHRKSAGVAAESIRKLRNRIAHHDSVLNLDVMFELEQLIKFAGMLSKDLERWINKHERVTNVFRARPLHLADTVIVAGKNAWPMYQDTGAYVCQAGRAFKPVDRMAFYTDGEIKPEFPAILARRDNVPWTQAEANRLLSSADSTDRKIGRVILYSQQHGWDGGRYQIFILTKINNGNREHRRRPDPIPHQKTGRGSAFVQKQRYSSVNRLQVVLSTADLESAQ